MLHPNSTIHMNMTMNLIVTITKQCAIIRIYQLFATDRCYVVCDPPPPPKKKRLPSVTELPLCNTKILRKQHRLRRVSFSFCGPIVTLLSTLIIVNHPKKIFLISLIMVCVVLLP